MNQLLVPGPIYDEPLLKEQEQALVPRAGCRMIGRVEDDV